jgi:hypothetical protein
MYTQEEINQALEQERDAGPDYWRELAAKLETRRVRRTVPTVPAPIKEETRLAIESAIQAILDEIGLCERDSELCSVCEDGFQSIQALEELLEERDA